MILARLTAIKQFAKDIHYTAKGMSFYGVHLLMDRVADGLDDYIDSIKEVCFMGAGEEPPSSKEVLSDALSYIPDVSSDTAMDIKMLQELIVSTLKALEEQREDAADMNLYNTISQDLKLKLGLISREVIK